MLQIHRGDLSQDALNLLCSQRLVACDTETSGLSWLTDQLQLVQFFSPGTGAHLVKVDSSQTATNIKALMESNRVQKVFHHAPFDLAFFKATWDIDARGTLCTKIASKLIAAGSAQDHTLQGLLARTLSIDISKGAVRTSDWDKDELSEAQIEYAVNDVQYLIPLLDSMEKSLEAKQLLGIFHECCEFLPVRARTDQSGLGDLFSY